MVCRKKIVTCLILMSVYSMAYSSCKIKAAEVIQVVSPLVRGVPFQVNADIKCLKGETFLEALLNQRLFYGPSGNGRHLVAKYYAKEANGLLTEHSSSEIVCGYKKEGTVFLCNLIDGTIERAKAENKIAMLYISDIDEVKAPSNQEQQLNHETSMMDQRAALEALRMESAKHNTDSSKIFVIFAANDLNNVYAPFINRLNGPAIEFANPDYEIRRCIFNKHFLEQENQELLKLKLPTCAIVEFANEIAEIAKLDEELSALDTQFWKEKAVNDKSWFNQANFMKTRNNAYKLSMTLSDLCSKLAQKWSDKLKEGSPNKQYYAIQQELYNVKNRSYRNQAFMYDNHDLFAKTYNQTRIRYPGRFVEQLAKMMIKTAIIKNNGLITSCIMEEWINKVTQPDPVLMGLQAILVMDKAFSEITRR